MLEGVDGEPGFEAIPAEKPQTINAAIAKQAAEVTEVVYGIPVFAKSIAAERKPME